MIKRMPILFILSGPSGVGKDALLKRMQSSNFPIKYVVTTTTRNIRPGEIDGVDYLFISQETFQLWVRQKKFLEYAEVYGNYYGVTKEQIDKNLKIGLDVIVKVDVQGFFTLKNLFPDAISIFLIPGNNKELEERLKNREYKKNEDVILRLKIANQEMKHISAFDYVLMNRSGRLGNTLSNIIKIIETEKVSSSRFISRKD